ncbi:MAG: NAD-dependent deacetylase [Myxococcales bacterium]|nr:NAD-dependent deacetylase [Myxococcales bacterium]
MRGADRGPEGWIESARGWIDASDRVVVLTGAGISTDSGIPDFRGPEGVWTRNPEAEKLATYDRYVGDSAVRKLAWQSRLEFANRLGDPNAGHRAVVELERRGKLHLLITQNIDGLHFAAGSTPERTVEIHGTFREVACLACAERGSMSEVFDRIRAGEADPACHSCGGILKAATISFGQGLVPEDLERSERAARRCDLMLALGTMLSVFPIANVVPLAKAAGARVVILNEQPTEMDALADAVIRGSISDILPRLVEPLP